MQLDYSRNYDEAYPENNLDTILTDNPLNDSLIEEIKSIPGVTDVMTREIVSVNLNGTRFPATIVSKKDFDFMRQEGDIGSMDYDQAVKNGDVFFGWSTWMEQDGYAPGESIAFDFENGSGTYTYQGKIPLPFSKSNAMICKHSLCYRPHLYRFFMWKMDNTKPSDRKQSTPFVLDRIILISIGYLLADVLPLNKRIWSPTFVLVTCGAASMSQS